MTPTQTTEPSQGTAGTPITKTVFDLASFSDVLLTKDFTGPAAVTSFTEALMAVGNDNAELLEVINQGLQDRARQLAAADMTGFKQIGEDGEPASEDYTGKYADGKKIKLINAAVLNLAKMFSGGNWDSCSKEQKRAHRTSATDMLRSNPAMLASIQG
jgi:hypothetical protein